MNEEEKEEFRHRTWKIIGKQKKTVGFMNKSVCTEVV